MEKKSLKPTIKILTFQHKFVAELCLMHLVLESREVYLYENVYDFLVDYNSIDKYEILIFTSI